MEQHYMKRQQQHQQHNMAPVVSASGSKSRFDSGPSSKSHHHKYGKSSSSHEMEYDMREIIDDEESDMMMSMAEDHHCMGDDSPTGSTNLLDVCQGLASIFITIFRFSWIFVFVYKFLICNLHCFFI